MIDIIGQEITNITTDGAVATNITYSGQQQLADIINMGTAIAYISWRKTAVIGDVNCLVLPPNASYEIRPTSEWNTLSVISALATTVQVVIK